MNFDIRYANVHEGRIVYQHAADLWLLDIASGNYHKIDIRLVSDLEQMREQWVDNPSPYITSVNSDSKGEKVVVTARGRVFVVPSQNWSNGCLHRAKKGCAIEMPSSLMIVRKSLFSRMKVENLNLCSLLQMVQKKCSP